MIKNVVFDIGNVLADFRWKEYMFEKGLDEEMIKRIARASVMTPYWDEFDRGAVSEEETIAAFIAADPEIEKELHLVYDNISGMVTKRDYAIPWIKSLKAAGYGVYYLSNFSRKASVECAEALDFLEYCDGGILSFKELVVKPDPEIYNRFLSRYGLKAEECVFIDDTTRNIVAAQALGWNGIVFGSREQVVEDLKKLGVSAAE